MTEGTKVTMVRRFVAGALTAAAACAPFAGAGYSSTSLIDIPESEYLDHMQFEADGIVAVSDSEDIPGYGVVGGNLGVGGMSELGVSVYSVWDAAAVVAHFKVELVDEEHYHRFQPAVSVGMDNLTLGDGIVSHAGRRLPADTAAYDMDFRDNISPFVVASKTFNALGTFHLGWGAGRFHGEGPRSDIFHGVFMGYNRRVWGKLEIMVEEDGRDVNVGVRHTFPWVTVGTAIEKVEQLGSSAFHPYYSVTLEFSPRVLHRGAERLALRRQINGVNERMVALKQQLDVQHDANVALADEITATVNTARAAGVDPKNVRAVYDEIDRLKAEIEQIEKERVAGQPNPPLGVDM